MTTLPPHLEMCFFKVMKGDINVLDFEQWLYSDKELESLFSADDYLNLISLNYKAAGAKNALWNVLAKHVDLGKFETFKLLEQLEEAKQRSARLPYLLMAFYNLYCNGYYFLQDLGLGYGLTIIGRSEEEWEELKSEEQQRLLQSFYPRLDVCLDRAIRWLRTGQVVLTGETDELGRHGFRDHRSTEEKEPLAVQYATTTTTQLKGHGSHGLRKDHGRTSWWQFWK